MKGFNQNVQREELKLLYLEMIKVYYEKFLQTADKIWTDEITKIKTYYEKIK